MMKKGWMPIVLGCLFWLINSGLWAQAPFEVLEVEGNVDLRLIKSRQYKVVASNKRHYKRPTIRRVGNKVCVNSPSSARHVVRVYAPKIQCIKFKGHGIIQGTGHHRSRFNVKVVNRGKTTLKGHLDIAHLQLAGKGKVKVAHHQSHPMTLHASGSQAIEVHGKRDIRQLTTQSDVWMRIHRQKGPYLKASLDNFSDVVIKGKVDTLSLKGWGQTHFDGRRLKARVGYIDLIDNARADVHVSEHLASRAASCSTIYYYQKPTSLHVNTSEGGNVLDHIGLEKRHLPYGTRLVGNRSHRHPHRHIKRRSSHPPQKRPSHVPASPYKKKVIEQFS